MARRAVRRGGRMSSVVEIKDLLPLLPLVPVERLKKIIEKMKEKK